MLSQVIDLVAQQDFKSWYDGNLDWAATAVRRTLLVVALIGGVTFLVISRNTQRAIRFAAVAAVFLGILFNLDAASGLFGTLFGA